ncbi:MAG: hypothetical protein O2917_00545 [Acidobacteria bacterium]|nr:hypothetical protein [Acidobacteriota bacterium]
MSARGADHEAAEDLLQHAFTKVIEQPADNVHGRSVVELVKAEGLTTTNAHVRLHRARRLCRLPL